MSRLIILAFFLTLLQGCDKDSTDPDDPISIKFQLLNAEGEPDSAFSVGENFEFSLTFINQTEANLHFKQSSLEDAREDFLRVYRVNENVFEDMGKPYQGLFCLEVGAITIPPGERSFTIPWQASDDYFPDEGVFFCFGTNQDFLATGNYYTSFESSLTFSGENGLTTGKILFEKEFKITN